MPEKTAIFGIPFASAGISPEKVLNPTDALKTALATKNPHAVALGRKGGRAKSEAKKLSGRANLEKARKAKQSKRRCAFQGCNNPAATEQFVCSFHLLER